MALQCNIDAKGKRVRLAAGVAVLVLGAVMMLLRNWWLGGICLAAGAFMIFEARAGWCALRAMGFRTKL